MIGLIALFLPVVDARVVNSRIISASIFRAGVSLVTREVSVPAGKGTYTLDVVPEAIDGGFWYGSPDEGTKVRDVVSKLDWDEKTVDFEPKSIGDFLAANIGKKLKFSIPKGSGELEQIEGTLLRMDEPPNGAAFFKLEGNRLRVVSPSSIIELDLTGLETIWKRKVKTPRIHIDFEVDAPKPTRVRWTTLEVGPAWTPSYLLELFPAKQAEMTAKVQLGLPGWTFENTDVQLLAGKPVVTTDWAADLAAAQGTIEAFLNRSGPQWRNDPADPFEGFQNWNQQLQSYYGGQQMYSYGLGGGGFGGGQGSSSPRVYQDTRSTDFFAREPEINRNGGVFAYPMGKLSMKPGDRLTRVIFTGSGTTERVVEWRFRAGTSNTLSDQVEVLNTGKLPWTGGRCSILNDGTPLAITSVPFTTPGAKAILKLGDAADLKQSISQTITPGEPIKTGNFIEPTAWHNMTLSLTNTRDEPLTLRLVFWEQCYELVADGADVSVGSEDVGYNPTRYATISHPIKGGETWEYKIRFRKRGEAAPGGRSGG